MNFIGMRLVVTGFAVTKNYMERQKRSRSCWLPWIIGGLLFLFAEVAQAAQAAHGPVSKEQAAAECEVWRSTVYPGPPWNGGGSCNDAGTYYYASSPGGFWYDGIYWPYSNKATAGPNLGDGGGCNGGVGGEGGCPKVMGSPSIGDPINPAIGNKAIEETDSNSEPVLTFRRFYNSSSDTIPGSFGAQWRHSFDRKLQRVEYPGSPQFTAPFTAVRPDGKFEVFYKNNAGVWLTDTDSPDTLVEERLNGVTTGYVLWVASLRIYESYSTSGLLQSITDTRGQVTRMNYSDQSTPASLAPAPGLLLTVIAPSGRALKFAYDESSRLSSVVLPDDQVITYDYDVAGNLRFVGYPDGKKKGYLYNESGLNSGSNLPNALTGIVDEAGSRYETTSYDNRGWANSASKSGGAELHTIVYNGDGSADVIFPSGSRIRQYYSYTKGHALSSTKNVPCGNCDDSYRERTYDANARPATYIDFRGIKTETTYDANGLLTSRVDASGSDDERTVQTYWDAGLRMPLLRMLKSKAGLILRKEGWAYDNHGLVTANCLADASVASAYTCSPTGDVPAGVRRTTSTYCSTVDDVSCPLAGLLLAVDGPRTDVPDVTRYTYYLDTDTSGCNSGGGPCHYPGDLKSITNAAGYNTTYVSYDKAGRPVRIRAPDGVLSDLSYTPRGWLAVRVIRANSDGSASGADATTTMAYNPDGTLHKLTDPDGVSIIYSYDLAHRLTDITDDLGNRIHYTLDASGNRIKEETFDASQVLRRSLSRTYNSLGQLILVKDGLGQVVFDASDADSYDASGNLLKSRGALGGHQNVVDALNRIVTSVDNVNGSDVATRNTTTQYAFDALDHLTEVTDPDGLITQYGFDGLGQPSSLQSPDTGGSSTTYDVAGNAVTQTDARGITVTRSYDAMGRVTAAAYADARANAAFHYDEANAVTGCTASYPQGRLTRVVEAAVTTTYCYDFQGRVIRKQQTQGFSTDTVDYVYTRAGRLAAVSTPSGTVTEYGRDALGQITSVKTTPPQGTAIPVVTAASYLPFGPIASYTLGNDQAVTRTYDANYRATDVVSPALNLHYQRDAAGNIVALGNTAGADPAIETYKYDSLHRLTSVNDPSGQAIEAYTYNKTGDRLSKVGPGLATGAYQYQSGTHLLTGIGAGSRTYNAIGAMTANASAGVVSGYGYDSRGRLSLVQLGGDTVAVYKYDAMGQRVAKALDKSEQRFVYNEISQLVGEYGNKDQDYVWMDDILVGVFYNATMEYVHTDSQGTPKVLTGKQGGVDWTWSGVANPFGERNPITVAGLQFNLRFPGQYYDSESGLNYNVHRYYDAASSRYVQSDPLGLDGGGGTYIYASNNPLIRIDPLGLKDYLDRCVGRYAICASKQDPDGFTVGNWVKFKGCQMTVNFGVAGGDKAGNKTGTIIACHEEWKQCISSFDTDPEKAPECAIEERKCLMKEGSR